MPATVGVEDQHPAKELEHDHQAGIGVLSLYPAAPFPANREHLAVKRTDRLVAVIVERVITAKVDVMLAQTEKLRFAVFEQEEGEVLGQQRPLVRRALEVDHVFMVA